MTLQAEQMTGMGDNPIQYLSQRHINFTKLHITI